MKLPRDVSGERLVRGLERVGYRVIRQSGSHARLTLDEPPQHHLTVPMHPELKAGTLAAILGLVARRLQIDRASLLASMRL